MHFTELFIRRPVMTTLVMLAILLFGVMSYRYLPVSDLPNVDFPTIMVTTTLPGASPETMASAVATPLERQFSTIAGLDSMSSTNALGLSQVTLQFNLSRSIDAAGQDVQAAIAKAAAQLPPELPTPPTYQKVNPADQPVLYLALYSNTLPLYTVDEYGETLMAQRISMINGVAQVQVFGAQKYAVRIQLDPKGLASKGLGINEVGDAVKNANVNLPTGTLYGSHQAVTVQATGQLLTAPAYRPLVVAYRGGKPVRLEDLGRVINSVENDKIASWFKNDRAIVLAIQRQPGTNTIEVVDAINKLLPILRQQIPASVDIVSLYDRSVTIRESVNDVQFTLLLALGLVILVIFLFLRNLSATVIPSLALPMSIVGTFAVMYILDYSLDNLSLMALILSVGFVVDDAIVVLENIVRHMEMGEAPLQAALTGSREIGFTILSMTLSLAAVFIPVFFMGGILGRLLHEFAVTIVAAILVSGLVSLTLTPMLCSRFLRPPKEERHGRLYDLTERFFQGLLALYDRTLQWVLRRRRRHHDRLTAAPDSDRGAVSQDSHGLPAQRGPGVCLRFYRSGRGHLLRRHAEPAEAGGGHRRQKSLCGQLFLLHRRGRAQRGRQYGAHLYPPDPPQPAAAGGEDRPGPAAPVRRHPRNEGLPADSAHHSPRRHAHQGPVPVHPAKPGHRRTLQICPAAAREDADHSGAD